MLTFSREIELKEVNRKAKNCESYEQNGVRPS